MHVQCLHCYTILWNIPTILCIQVGKIRSWTVSSYSSLNLDDITPRDLYWSDQVMGNYPSYCTIHNSGLTTLSNHQCMYDYFIFDSGQIQVCGIIWECWLWWLYYWEVLPQCSGTWPAAFVILSVLVHYWAKALALGSAPSYFFKDHYSVYI